MKYNYDQILLLFLLSIFLSIFYYSNNINNNINIQDANNDPSNINKLSRARRQADRWTKVTTKLNDPKFCDENDRYSGRALKGGLMGVSAPWLVSIQSFKQIPKEFHEWLQSDAKIKEIITERVFTEGGKWEHVCNGVIVSDEFVLTTAYCVLHIDSNEKKHFIVISGTYNYANYNNSKISNIKEIHLPTRGYHRTHATALIRVDQKFEFLAGKLEPICFDDSAERRTGKVEIFGWSNENNEVVYGGLNRAHFYFKYFKEPIIARYLDVNLMGYCPNTTSFNNTWFSCATQFKNKNPPPMICSDDYGGPVIKKKGNKFYLIGIMSPEYELTEEKDKWLLDLPYKCDPLVKIGETPYLDPTYPIYLPVELVWWYKDWIRAVVDENSMGFEWSPSSSLSILDENDCGKGNPDDYPWLVSLRFLQKKKFIHFCGGSIVSRTHVISSRACILAHEKYLIKVVAGVKHSTSISGPIHYVNRTIMYTPKLEDEEAAYNIMLLVVEPGFTFNQDNSQLQFHIEPICVSSMTPFDKRFNRTFFSINFGSWSFRGGLTVENITKAKYNNMNYTLANGTIWKGIIEVDDYHEYMCRLTSFYYNKYREICIRYQEYTNAPSTNLYYHCQDMDGASLSNVIENKAGQQVNNLFGVFSYWKGIRQEDPDDRPYYMKLDYIKGFNPGEKRRRCYRELSVRYFSRISFYHEFITRYLLDSAPDPAHWEGPPSASTQPLHAICGKDPNDPEDSGKMTGGSPEASGGFRKKIPWLALVFGRKGRYNYEFLCGGTIVSYYHVVVATHCILPPYRAPFLIKAGASSIEDDVAQERYTRYVVPYYNFWPNFGDMIFYDFTLLVTKSAFSFHADGGPWKVAPICAENPNRLKPDALPYRMPGKLGHELFLTAWGRFNIAGQNVTYHNGSFLIKSPSGSLTENSIKEIAKKRIYPNFWRTAFVKVPIKTNKPNTSKIMERQQRHILFALKRSSKTFLLKKNWVMMDEGCPVQWFDRKNRRWVFFGLQSFAAPKKLVGLFEESFHRGSYFNEDWIGNTDNKNAAIFYSWFWHYYTDSARGRWLFETRFRSRRGAEFYFFKDIPHVKPNVTSDTETMKWPHRVEGAG